MTKEEWLDKCEFMHDPMIDLMNIARSMNISGPVTIAINKDGISWAEHEEAGHVYEYDAKPDGFFNVRCDRESYFSDKDLTATSTKWGT